MRRGSQQGSSGPGARRRPPTCETFLTLFPSVTWTIAWKPSVYGVTVGRVSSCAPKIIRVRHRPVRRIELGLLVVGWAVGLGTNLVTADVGGWWPPLRLVADTAPWWLSAVVVLVLGYELARRWRRHRTKLWHSSESPYPGLMAFTADRSAVFFGREREVNECLAHLNRAGAPAVSRQLILVGPSGAGKILTATCRDHAAPGAAMARRSAHPAWK